MKLIGPVAPPGVRHVVKLKDGSTAVAFMSMGREGVPDGTWIGPDGPVDAVDIIGPYRPGVQAYTDMDEVRLCRDRATWLKDIDADEYMKMVRGA